MGDTLSDSGQINNQQIIVPECRLHEDIGSLLLKQTLTDVTLVVMASPNSPAGLQGQDNALRSPNISESAIASLKGEGNATICQDSEQDSEVDEEAREDEEREEGEVDDTEDKSRTPHSGDDTEVLTAVDAEGEGSVSSALPPHRGLLRFVQPEGNEAVRKAVPSLVSCSSSRRGSMSCGDRFATSTYSASCSSSSSVNPANSSNTSRLIDASYAYSDG